MTENHNSEEQKSTNKLAVTGLIVSAVAGVIYLYGRDGRQRRKRVRGWMLQMKGEIMERLTRLEEVSKDKYKQIIDKVSSQFAQQKRVHQEDIDRIRERLKGHWSDIREAVNEHVAYVKNERDEVPNTPVTQEIAEAVRDTADSIESQEGRDTADLLKMIVSSGDNTSNRDQNKEFDK